MTSGGPYTGVEGSAVSIAAAVTDPEGAPVTAAWSVVSSTGTDPGGTCTFAVPAAATTTVSCSDDGNFLLRIAGSDGTTTATSDAILTISNAAPVVAITAPTTMSQVMVRNAVTVSAAVTDPGANDTHTCRVDWGDGTVTDGLMSSERCSGSHMYASLGVRTVTVTATDDDGGVGTDFIDLVVATPATTKVTGGGFLTTGKSKTSVGFVAQPDERAGYVGQIQVRIQSTKDRFHGDSVISMSGSANTATWSGSGAWNGVAGYTFTISVTDAGKSRKAGARDSMSLVISLQGRTVYRVTGDLQGGNLTVH